jgi:hypothetical protein
MIPYLLVACDNSTIFTLFSLPCLLFEFFPSLIRVHKFFTGVALFKNLSQPILWQSVHSVSQAAQSSNH